jgi:hypothetical protein
MKHGKPPQSVVIAAWLLVAYGVLSLARIWLFGSGMPDSVVGFTIWGIAVASIAFLARSLYLGRNWSRWLLAIAVALAIVVFPFQKPELPDGPQLGIYVLQILMPIAASALTFTARAKAWFQA